MASIKLTRNEVLGLLFVDPDYEGEYLPDSESESIALHQAQTVNPLPNLDGPLPNVSGGNNVSRGRSVHREVSRRVSVVGNEAGDFYHVCLSTIAATVLWWILCLMPLGMLDEVEVFIGQLGGNVEAGWGVAMTMTVVRAVHTRRVREADLAVLLPAGAETV